MSALGGSRKVFDDCRRVTGQVRQILLAEDKDDDDDAVEGMAAIVGRMSDVLSAATKALAPPPHIRRGRQSIINGGPFPILPPHLRIGDDIVPAIQTIVSDPGFKGVISSPPEVLELGNFKQNFNKTRGAEILAISHGTTHVKKIIRINGYKKPGQRFKCPDLGETPVRPSRDKIWTFLEGIFVEKPEGPVPYYTGKARAEGLNLRDLDPGEALSRFVRNNPVLKSLAYSYFHIGSEYSATPFHFEDGDLWAYNIVSHGFKLWILIKTEDNEKFEAFVMRLFPCECRAPCLCKACDRWVLHQAVIFAPSLLDQEGISYSIICQGPGDIVIVRPRQYHAVVNFSSCVARSSNFKLPGEQGLSTAINACRSCVFYSYDHELVTPVEFEAQLCDA